MERADLEAELKELRSQRDWMEDDLNDVEFRISQVLDELDNLD